MLFYFSSIHLDKWFILSDKNTHINEFSCCILCFATADHFRILPHTDDNKWIASRKQVCSVTCHWSPVNADTVWCTAEHSWQLNACHSVYDIWSNHYTTYFNFIAVNYWTKSLKRISCALLMSVYLRCVDARHNAFTLCAFALNAGVRSGYGS